MATNKIIIVARREEVTSTFCQKCRDLVMNTARDIKKHTANKKCFPGIVAGEVDASVAQLSADGALMDDAAWIV